MGKAVVSAFSTPRQEAEPSLPVVDHRDKDTDYKVVFISQIRAEDASGGVMGHGLDEG